MTRVPLDVAAKVAEVDKATIRKWVSRGHIGRYDDGYDLTELMLWLDQTRDTGKAIGAVIATHNREQGRMSA